MSPLDKQKVIGMLLDDVEEEEICMSLLDFQYQEEKELRFFNPEQREKVTHILKQLAADSKRHKEMIIRMIEILEKTKKWNMNT